MKKVEFSELNGLTITKIDGLNRLSEKVTIHTKEGRVFEMYHNQDCCEVVYLADFHVYKGYVGEVTEAKVETNNIDTPEALYYYNEDGTETLYYDKAWLWTFYIINTEVGKITLRWFGSSNGYYSEEVDFYEAKGEIKMENIKKQKEDEPKEIES